ncbi:MAG: hypothetical protein P1U89_27310 [Verrucomicrobiales bacterium]|nr:hypothetical protein [Verrucomicrobiales bacterium]
MKTKIVPYRPVKTSSDLIKKSSPATLSRVIKLVKRVWNWLPEAAPWMPENEAAKMLGDTDDYMVFNGSYIRVSKRRSDGNISTENIRKGS